MPARSEAFSEAEVEQTFPQEYRGAFSARIEKRDETPRKEEKQ
jgi:hypothetical protein